MIGVFWIENTLHTQAWNLLLEKGNTGLTLTDLTTSLVAQLLSAPVFSFNDRLTSRGVVLMPGQC